MAQDKKQFIDQSSKQSINVELIKSNLEQLKSEALVVFVSKKATKTEKKATAPTVLVEGVSKALEGKVAAAAESGTITGAAQEAVLFRDTHFSGTKHLIVVGLGDSKGLTAETLRQSAAQAAAQIKSAKIKTAAIAVDSIAHTALSAETITQAVTEGLLLAAYGFNEFKTDKKDDGLEKLTLVSSHKNKSHEKGLETAQVISECVNFSRWLGDRPGNRMTPSILADETVKAAKGTKLKVSVWDKARIKSEKMGSFLSVSLGSSQDPRFIVMEYNGAAASKKPVCYVGKGLTFDSGGISIKPSGGMEEMKYDMCGGAAVIGTMLAIAKLKLKVNVIGLVPATENMPGPAAIKPGDIVTARNGKTIEVNNTDAEGRLILNDALVYACEQKPAVILDVATLTGAMAVALGNLHTGYFTRHDKLSTRIENAAKESGEWVWRMPLTDHHARDMKGTYADLSNMSSGKGAGSATAAAFLEQFVDKDIPWAHFDIAGTAWNTGDRVPYNPRKGASGAIIRTFIQFAMNE
jgi:leucyl aminopeptidase